MWFSSAKATSGISSFFTCEKFISPCEKWCNRQKISQAITKDVEDRELYCQLLVVAWIHAIGSLV